MFLRRYIHYLDKRVEVLLEEEHKGHSPADRSNTTLHHYSSYLDKSGEVAVAEEEVGEVAVAEEEVGVRAPNNIHHPSIVDLAKYSLKLVYLLNRCHHKEDKQRQGNRDSFHGAQTLCSNLIGQDRNRSYHCPRFHCYNNPVHHTNLDMTETNSTSLDPTH